MLRIILIIVFCSFLTSCYQKHLDEKIFQNKDITVKWYRISEITTVHDFIDLERDGYTNTILSANTDGIYDIKISADTVIIQSLPDLLIYDLAAIKQRTYIKLDTSITKYQYMKKFQPTNAKYYLEEGKKE